MASTLDRDLRRQPVKRRRAVVGAVLAMAAISVLGASQDADAVYVPCNVHYSYWSTYPLYWQQFNAHVTIGGSHYHNWTQLYFPPSGGLIQTSYSVTC